MKNERKFFKCPHCGDIVSYVQHAGPGVSCCGEMMQQILPNTVDAAKEKHVPSAVREGNKLIVTVGSVPHPMTEEHYIGWIVIADGDRTQRVTLTSLQTPSADFFISDDPVTVYAYCNLHGLWEAQA